MWVRFLLSLLKIGKFILKKVSLKIKKINKKINKKIKKKIKQIKQIKFNRNYSFIKKTKVKLFSNIRRISGFRVRSHHSSYSFFNTMKRHSFLFVNFSSVRLPVSRFLVIRYRQFFWNIPNQICKTPNFRGLLARPKNKLKFIFLKMVAVPLDPRYSLDAPNGATWTVCTTQTPPTTNFNGTNLGILPNIGTISPIGIVSLSYWYILKKCLSKKTFKTKNMILNAGEKVYILNTNMFYPHQENIRIFQNSIAASSPAPFPGVRGDSLGANVSGVTYKALVGILGISPHYSLRHPRSINTKLFRFTKISKQLIPNLVLRVKYKYRKHRKPYRKRRALRKVTSLKRFLLSFCFRYTRELRRFLRRKKRLVFLLLRKIKSRRLLKSSMSYISFFEKIKLKRYVERRPQRPGSKHKSLWGFGSFSPLPLYFTHSSTRRGGIKPDFFCLKWVRSLFRLHFSGDAHPILPKESAINYFFFNPFFLKLRTRIFKLYWSPEYASTSASAYLGSEFLSSRAASNIYPHAPFKYIILKQILASRANSFFNEDALPMIYTNIIRLMEVCSGKKTLIQIYPHIMQSVDTAFSILYQRWVPRMRYYERRLGHRFFLGEALNIIHLSFSLHDSKLFLSWLRAIIKRISFWKTRLIFRFMKYLIENYFKHIFTDLSIRGLKLKLKGKISVSGNSRKRTILYRTGTTSHSTVNVKVLHEFSTIGTFTGVMGFQFWLFY